MFRECRAYRASSLQSLQGGRLSEKGAVAPTSVISRHRILLTLPYQFVRILGIFLIFPASAFVMEKASKFPPIFFRMCFCNERVGHALATTTSHNYENMQIPEIIFRFHFCDPTQGKFLNPAFFSLLIVLVRMVISYVDSRRLCCRTPEK